jgi:hypothetical protein
MRVAHGDRQGVGGVLGQRAGDVEQTFDHQLNLFLLRAAGADHGELHLARRILENPRPDRERRAQRGAARLAELEGAVRVPVHEHALDCHLVRAEFARERLDADENLLQPLGQRLAARADCAAGDVGDARSLRLDDCVARALRARVEAEDAHLGGQRAGTLRQRQLGKTLRAPESAQGFPPLRQFVVPYDTGNGCKPTRSSRGFLQTIQWHVIPRKHRSARD